MGRRHLEKKNIRKFRPYRMSDVRRASKKELFTVVSTFGGGGGSPLGYSLGGGKVLLNIDFVSEIDIGDEFPLHELRSPSMSVTNVALVIVPIKYIATGLKILRAFGFNYRDTFVPNSGYEDLILMNNEAIVLRGERGKTQSLKTSYVPSDSLDDLTEWMSENYVAPFVSVFSETNHPEFSAIFNRS